MAHRLYFESGYIVEIRNAELLRVAIRNDNEDGTLLEQFVWPVCLERINSEHHWQIVFDVTPLAGEPFDPVDQRPAIVRWYVGKEKLERVRAFRNYRVTRTHWQIDKADFDVRFERPTILVIE